MQVQTMTEQLLFTTVRITTTAAGQHGSGTGFLLAEDRPEGGVAMLLVTNKHVIEGATEVTLHLIAAGPANTPALGKELTLTCTPSQFRGHPDPEIDIAVIGVGGALQQLADAGTPAFFRSVSPSMCATKEVLEDYEPIEPVTFIGYPNGLYDSASLLPIVRQGFAATAMNIDYEAKPIFLIDASVFPGSSGSPVFLVPRPSAPDKRGNITLGGPPRPPILLGIVAAVHQRQVPVILAAAKPGVPIVHELIDLGIVYKASAIHELAKQVISPGP
jgi:S1-C subfamily serine protease